MSSVVIAGDTSGSVTLSAPSVAGTTTLTLPSTSGNVVTDSATQTLTNKTLTSPTFTGTATGTVLVSGTAVASTSGTSITFSSIPSWVKRITVMLYGVSTSDGADVILQLGSGSTTTTGYVSQRVYTTGATPIITSSTSSIIGWVTNTGADTKYGTATLTNVNGNNWVGTAQHTTNNGLFAWSCGGIALSGALDRIVITAANGTATFDAGTINILYE